MIVSLGVKLYTATEVAGLIGISRDTLSDYSKRADIPVRRIQRVRYYTEEEIRNILQIPGNKMNTHKITTQTPEEESRFWKRVDNAIGEEESPREETDSYICYVPEEGLAINCNNL